MGAITIIILRGNNQLDVSTEQFTVYSVYKCSMHLTLIVFNALCEYIQKVYVYFNKDILRCSSDSSSRTSSSYSLGIVVVDILLILYVYMTLP